jgi:hypothetical protein
VGLFPFNRQIIIGVIHKHQVYLKEESEQKRLAELKLYLDEKIAEHKKMYSEQVERRASSATIKFSTATTKVLTTSITLGRLQLYKEWKGTKSLKKKDLIEKMIQNYGFPDDICSKKLDELRKMVEQHLLSREKELVESYQKELNSVTVPIPPSIASFFAAPRAPEAEEKMEEVPDESFADMEKKMITFLEECVGNPGIGCDELLALLT